MRGKTVIFGSGIANFAGKVGHQSDQVLCTMNKYESI